MLNSPMPPKALFRQQALIGGQWCSAQSGQVLAVKNPANGEVVGRIPQLSAGEVSRAIEAAHEAGKTWSKKSPAERCGILRRWFELCLSHKDDLATLLMLEQGKPLAEAKGEIDYGLSFIEWYAEEGKRANGQTLCHPSTERRIVTLLQPVGVVTAITPWNFPNAMLTRKCAPALAAGCTVVLKPASQTPFSALALALLAEEAGLPAGVLNVVTGTSHELSSVLTQHPLVRKLSFTGSTEVGVQLQTQAAKRMLRTSMELGGNAPFMVFEDADLDKAVEGLLLAKFRNAGQSCVAANRVYLQAKIYDQFVDKFKAKVSQLRVGPGWLTNVQLGPLINDAARDKLVETYNLALNAGAQCVVGGDCSERFFQATVLTEVEHESIFLREETFGPLAPMIRFEDEAQVLAWANEVSVGLAAYVYTQNHQRVWRMAEGLEAGMVGINEGLVSTAVAPFGGVKMSGLGREGSALGLNEYMEVKYCCHGL
jgi:succinate-semialdehyde dehydrogenase / glutarate-semialdehyde dehydrogenase